MTKQTFPLIRFSNERTCTGSFLKLITSLANQIRKPSRKFDTDNHELPVCLAFTRIYSNLQAYCTEKRAKYVGCLVYILCFLLTASTPFEWVAETTTSDDTGGGAEANETVITRH